MGSLEGMKIQLDGIAHILADNHLHVPKYQRSYAWETKNITDLFKDVTSAIRQNTNDYFLGSIVITGTSKDHLEVVDGQQRLATTTILLAAIRDHFYQMGDTNRAEDISRSYLMHRNLRDQERVPKLFLNDIDHNFFSKRVLSSPDDPIRSIPPSEGSHKRIENAAQLAARYVKELVTQADNPTSVLVDWIDFLLTKAKVICVTVSDQANAFTIFETLNDRGLDLAVSDLLKNYVFSLARDRFDEVQRKWLMMTSILESVEDEEIVVTYIRHFWSSSEGPTREKDLYAGIKGRIINKQDVISFTDDLYRNARLYAAILNPNHELWDKYGTETREHVATLNLLGTIQMRPVIAMAVLDKFTDNEVKRSLKVMVSWGVRFLIVGGFGGGGMGRFSRTESTRNPKG